MTYGYLVNGPQDGAWSLSFAAMAFIYFKYRSFANLLNFMLKRLLGRMA